MKPSVFSGGKYLKADDLKTGDLIKVITEGEENVSKTFKYPEFTQSGKPHPFANQYKAEFTIGVELGGGEKKTLRMNRTSFENLASAWGDDTVNWVNKLAKVSIVPLPMNGKKMIILEAESTNE